jgi:hypothetical protein
MPGKMARSDFDQAFGLLEVLVAVSTASVLREGRENANIDAGLGFIWRISAKMLRKDRYSWKSGSQSIGGVDHASQVHRFRTDLGTFCSPTCPSPTHGRCYEDQL